MFGPMKEERRKFIESKEFLAYLDNDFKIQSTPLVMEKFDELDYDDCLDLGCGKIKYPFKNVLQVDGNLVCEPDILADLGEEQNFGEFDLVVSIEVAEHIEPELADNFVENLTKHSRRWIVITASPVTKEKSPYCLKAHLNEQDKNYWIEKIEKHGFTYDKDKTESWQNHFSNRIVPEWFKKDLMIFKK